MYRIWDVKQDKYLTEISRENIFCWRSIGNDDFTFNLHDVSLILVSLARIYPKGVFQIVVKEEWYDLYKRNPDN